ncbi:MAG: hypothetical protein KBC47_03855 [Candidatus Peribacteraceae bacterium]|nr:hypothetical protein [Candidatus Peribacteraceae bacterium]
MARNESATHRSNSAEVTTQSPLERRPTIAIATTAFLAASLFAPQKLEPEFHNDTQPIAVTPARHDPSAVTPDASSNFFDVNGDGKINARDALATIHTLNARSTYDQVTDVNRDGRNSPLDTLLIINHLNNLPEGAMDEAILQQSTEARAKIAATTVFE